MSMKTEGLHFQGMFVKDGLLMETEDASETKGQQKLEVWGITEARPFSCHQEGTYFVLVVQGVLFIRTGLTRTDARVYLPRSGWAVLHRGDVIAAAGKTKAVAIFMPGYNGLRQFGAALEERGRLRYIDGCSDTLLVCPPVKGEPCLNHLHIPNGITQTRHTHPSDRIGIIVGGRGLCITPGPPGMPDLHHPLEPGLVWRIPRGGEHSFHTTGDKEEFLDVIAFHPDSDFGPEHDYHPMLNRTLVEGVSANEESLAGIRTKSIDA